VHLIIGVTWPYTVERSLPPLSHLDVVYCAGEEVSAGASRTSQLKVVCYAICNYGETLQRQHKEVCMSSRRRPPKVQPGMTIGIVTPSSPVRDRGRIERGVAVLESLGFRTVFGAHVHDRRPYRAEDDRSRADDLLAMFFRDDVDAVMCVQGGYGGIRTMRWLDADRLAQLAQHPPKPFIGFSDITYPHIVFGKALDCTTFWGPNLAQLDGMSDYTRAAFRRALMETEPFDVLPDPDDPYVETLVPGVAEGELVGGTLRPIVCLTGTPWELDLRGKIFFFEGAGMPPIEADRLLGQMLLAGRLQECAGIIIGEHVGRPEGETLFFDEVFDDLIRPLGIPTLYHMPLGHGKHLATVPLGARVRLDATNKTLQVLEPGVC